MVQNSIFRFREIFMFNGFFSFSDIFIFRDISYSEKFSHSMNFFQKIAVSQCSQKGVSRNLQKNIFSYKTMHLMEFTREFCRMHEYCYFSKKCSPHRRYSITLKIFCSRVTLTGNILGGVIFQYSCSKQIGQDKLRQKNLG